MLFLLFLQYVDKVRFCFPIDAFCSYCHPYDFSSGPWSCPCWGCGGSPIVVVPQASDLYIAPFDVHNQDSFVGVLLLFCCLSNCVDLSHVQSCRNIFDLWLVVFEILVVLSVCMTSFESGQFAVLSRVLHFVGEIRLRILFLFVCINFYCDVFQCFPLYFHISILYHLNPGFFLWFPYSFPGVLEFSPFSIQISFQSTVTNCLF